MPIRGKSGDDDLNGTSGNDTFNLTRGGDDTANGGAGNDTFWMGAALTAADRIDGGSGNDRVNLSGDYSAGLTFDAATMVNVETLALQGGHSYYLALNDGNVAAGQTLSVKAVGFGAGDTLTLDGTGETDGFFAVKGGAGDDNVAIGNPAVLSGSTFDGGAGSDILDLNGDFSAGATITGAMLRNVETLGFATGHDYNLTTTDDAVASGAQLSVSGYYLGASDSLTFDGSAETDGNFYFLDGKGDDVLTGSQNGDTFDLSFGAGNDTLHGGGGGDGFLMGSQFTAADRIDGGPGNDSVFLAGDYSGGNAVTFGAATMTNVEALNLIGGGFDLTTNDATVTAGASLTVDASSLDAGKTLTFDGAAETDGTFAITGSAGDDVLTGGDGGDSFTGGTGADHFVYTAVAQSTSAGFDTIVDLDFGAGDRIGVSGFAAVPGAINTIVSTGTLDSGANFDIELGNAIGESELGGHDAVLYTPGKGSLAGHAFLVVDINGTPGYQAGADLVIDVTGFAGTLSTGDFV